MTVKPDKSLPPICGITEAAEILGIHRGHVARVIAAGHLPKDGDRRLTCGPIWLKSTVMTAKKAIAAERKARAKGKK